MVREIFTFRWSTEKDIKLHNCKIQKGVNKSIDNIFMIIFPFYSKRLLYSSYKRVCTDSFIQNFCSLGKLNKPYGGFLEICQSLSLIKLGWQLASYPNGHETKQSLMRYVFSFISRHPIIKRTHQFLILPIFKSKVYK